MRITGSRCIVRVENKLHKTKNGFIIDSSCTNDKINKGLICHIGNEIKINIHCKDMVYFLLDGTENISDTDYLVPEKNIFCICDNPNDLEF